MPSISEPEAQTHMRHRAAQPSWYSERRLVKTPSCLDFTFVEATQLDEWLSHSSAHTLALLSFGAPLPSLSRPVNCPTLFIDLPQLAETAKVEVWTSNRPVQMTRHNQVSAAMNGHVAAAFLSVEETAGVALEATTYQAYRHLISALKELGYSYLWRAWNYFPAINDDENGMERYQRFCMGRHHALVEELKDFPASLPAATAVGTASGPFQVFALAGTLPATHLGNPRQVHAYEYPKSYGPCSPSFARATIARLDGSAKLLFLAGTASVVGHASRHADSSHVQTQESLENISVLVRHAHDTHRTGSFVDPGRAIYKVYVRHGRDLSGIRQAIKGSPLSQTSLFLQGDLCRRELLVEIESVLIRD
jgi:chorismate lyase / 3-hydroxybenzoate synthase